MNVRADFEDKPEDVSFASEEDAVHESQNVEAKPAAKKILPVPPLDDIEITTNSFIDCAKFLLSKGVRYGNPRVFSQDHLEQHFGKQRFRGGGSSNPNYARFLQNNTGWKILEVTCARYV